MISVILYGRNDSHGYNLHKRAAISFNCIAEMLTHPNDEIIFVDCNTPDDLPTFPESIQDTLTARAKQLLRIFRLRPTLYEKHKNGSHLYALEPLSRNIGIRRTNPANRWILSTNTDMVFVSRLPGKSLSDLAAKLPDGFYELPRFEVPETLWEGVTRTDPVAIMQAFHNWGQRLHLNEVVQLEPFIRYDGPGDFQLMLREQTFNIHGFNEQMVWGWHSDSNLCKRMFLLNGKTDSLIDLVFSFHCDHTRQATLAHSHNRKENDADLFVYQVSQPAIPEQAQTWGLPETQLEELHLTNTWLGRYESVLKEMLPGLSVPMLDVRLGDNSYNHSLFYDTQHAFPYVADQLMTFPPEGAIGYSGGNGELLRLIAELRQKLRHSGQIIYNQQLMAAAYERSVPIFPENCIPRTAQQIPDLITLFIFDAAMMNFPNRINPSDFIVPAITSRVISYSKAFFEAFLISAEHEHLRREAKIYLPRKFVLIAAQHNWFESAASQYIGMVPVPFSCHLRHGYLLEDAFTDPKRSPPLHTLIMEDKISARCEWLSAELGYPVSEKDYETCLSLIVYLISSSVEVATFKQAWNLVSNHITNLHMAVLRLELEIRQLDGINENTEALQKLLQFIEGEMKKR